MPYYPSQDLTNQFVSTSYQNVVQRYNDGTNEYFLNGLGYVISYIPSASLGYGILTTNQSASFAFSSSISNISLVSEVAFLADTASIAVQAETASYVIGQPAIKSGVVLSSSFGGSPFTISLLFVNSFTNDYSVTFGSTAARIFTVQNKSLDGFTVNSNSDILFSGSLYWQAIQYGEFNN